MKNDVVFISEEKLVENFKSLGPHMAVTEGHYELPSVAAIRDMDWNHMDHHHRHFIHQMYGETLRIARDQNFAVSMTKIKAAIFKLFVLLVDIRVKPGYFYQVFNVFNLIYIHNITRAIEGKGINGGALRTITWYIVSPAWLKFLHPVLNRKMLRINEVQNPEDIPVLEQRTKLRKKGFAFASDEPDYLNSNLLTCNTKYPKLGKTYQIGLENMKLNSLEVVSAGPVDFMVRRDEEDKTQVWLRECPHEGAPLEGGTFSGCEVKCPWHGLKFNSLTLSKSNSSGKLSSFEVKLSGSELFISDLN